MVFHAPRVVGILVLCLLLTACRSRTTSDQAAKGEPNLPERMEGADLTTRSVTYVGRLEEGGITVYQQGTHHLTLTGGTVILLESRTVPLDLYEGQRVQVRGDIRPTVEAGGIIMDVREVFLLGAGAPVLDEAQVATGSQVGAEGTGSALQERKEEREEEIDGVRDREGLREEEEKDREPEQMRVVDHTAAIAAMAKEDIRPERWTQEYCTTHIGFCVPIHRNWWFTSFGATTTARWHVEISNQAVERIGDGVIVIELREGSLELVGVREGASTVEGGRVTVARAWDDQAHLAVVGDARLEAAVVFMAKGIRRIPEP